ncbi:MAG: SMC-Scp complex subunit ScpB [Candidatus Kaiserbacteria bacterium]|nr:SMC-Scp complex subunit ScpB [Candidatus Kaiserbacteria bacterium]
MNQDHVAKLEALLFTHGSPLTKKSAASFLGCKVDEIDSIADALAKERLASGVVPVDDGTSLSLVSSPRLDHFMQQVHQKEKTAPLSNAAQETLSLIAYAGPITKIDLDFLRGVNTQYTTRQLLVRGLIQEVSVGKARAFDVTADLLSHLGVSKKGDLPEYAEIHESLRKGLEEVGGNER